MNLDLDERWALAIKRAWFKTQDELADTVGCSKQVLNHIKKGKTKGDNRWRKIEVSLGVSQDWLQYGPGPTERDADGDLSPTVRVEIDYIGCYGDLPRQTRARIERAIERRLGLVGWSCEGGEQTEAGEVWTYRRPAHRPRRDPSAARVTLTARVHPDTRKRLDAARAKTGEGLGELIDRLAAGLGER